MDDLALPPVPTGRSIIQFAKDVDVKEISHAVESTTWLIASADAMDVDVSVPILAGLNIGVGQLDGDQMNSLADDDRVQQVRREFYMFDSQTLNEETLEWMRQGLHKYIDLLRQEEKEPQDPWPFKEEAIKSARYADTAETTWGLKAVGADRTALDGAGIKVCVLDTGLDLEHPDFASRPLSARCRSFVAGEDVQDGQGHGTHVAGIIAGPTLSNIGRRYGVAPGVDLYVGKVLNNRGSGREFDILSGIEWALEQGCHIISMSLGRAVRRNERADPIYEAVGQAALDKGCLIIAAAGNDSAREYGYIAPVGSPANASTIMAVGAVDARLRVSPFSCGSVNQGGEVDVVAPGSSVYSAYPQPRGSKLLSGTSMSCPYVSAVAALHAQDQVFRDPDTLWKKIIESVSPIAGKRDYGAGLVQSPSRTW